MPYPILTADIDWIQHENVIRAATCMPPVLIDIVIDFVIDKRGPEFFKRMIATNGSTALESRVRVAGGFTVGAADGIDGATACMLVALPNEKVVQIALICRDGYPKSFCATYDDVWLFSIGHLGVVYDRAVEMLGDVALLKGVSITGCVDMIQMQWTWRVARRYVAYDCAETVRIRHGGTM